MLVLAVPQRYAGSSAGVLGPTGSDIVLGRASGQSIRGQRVRLRGLAGWERTDIGYRQQTHVSTSRTYFLHLHVTPRCACGPTPYLSLCRWTTPGIGPKKTHKLGGRRPGRQQKNDGRGDGAAESNEHRPDEFFGYAFRHLIPLSILVKLFWSPYQSLPYPLMGVADQFPELGKGADVWNPGENYIQRCLFVVDQGLVSCRLLSLCVDTSLHTHLTHFVRRSFSLRPTLRRRTLTLTSFREDGAYWLHASCSTDSCGDAAVHCGWMASHRSVSAAAPGPRQWHRLRATVRPWLH